MVTKKAKDEKKNIPPLKIENAQLLWRNFSGAAKKFNAKGLRNFHVVLDSTTAKDLEGFGWNVRWHEPKEDGDQAYATLKVAVRFDNYPPRILMISGGERTTLDEESIDVLDWADIKTADLVLSGSHWSVDKKTGIKAYLKKAFITLVEDDLEAKYRKVVTGGNKHSVEEADED